MYMPDLFPPEINTSGTFKANARNTMFLKWQWWQQQQQWQQVSIWIIEPFRLMSSTIVRIQWKKKKKNHFFNIISIERLLIRVSRIILFVWQRKEKDRHEGLNRPLPKAAAHPRSHLSEAPNCSPPNKTHTDANGADSPARSFQQNN